MEVEVKLRLPDKAAYDAVQALMSSGWRVTHQQENFFFDGPERQLNSRRVVLRVRFYNGDERAVVTLKGEQILKDGIGTAPEVEEPADVQAARTWLSDPSALLALPSPLIQGLARQYGLTSLTCLGGFKNLRKEFDWEGFVLELDETAYEWGTLYELECETADPEALRDRLEQTLGNAGIKYSYSSASKFKNFVNRTLV